MEANRAVHEGLKENELKENEKLNGDWRPPHVVIEPPNQQNARDATKVVDEGDESLKHAGRRPSKMDTAIETIRKSWDDFHRTEVEMVLLTPAGKKAMIASLVPQEKMYRRKSSATFWDLKDARVSLASPRTTGIKVYRRRWLMLAIYTILGIANTFQWTQYSIIANIIQRYYNVSSLSVDLTCMSYLIAYLIFFIPASWLLDKWGLRCSLTVAAGTTALGSWVKVGSVGRDRFWITMIGQAIVALGQVFMLFLPPRLAAVWFGPNQVSLACSIGFIGVLIGNAVGLVLPPLLVQNSEDTAAVSSDLRSMFLGVAACTTAALVLQLALFQNEPPLPPSPAQQLQRNRYSDPDQKSDFWGSLGRLMQSPQFLLLLLAWALNVGVFCAINTLLSQLVLPFHPGSEEKIGMVGLFMITSGIVGSFMCGIFLDKTHRYKAATMMLFIISLIGWGIFTIQLDSDGFSWVYFAAVVYGFAMTAVQPVGLEFGAEITFPEPEGTSGAVMCSAVQLSGLLLTFVGGHLLEVAGALWSMAFLCAPLLLACFILAFIKPELKRQEAQRSPVTQMRTQSLIDSS